MTKKSVFVQIFLLFFLFSTVLVHSQTITSSASGGHWNDAATWIGGLVPGANNDVVINGPIVIGNQECFNLTINSSGSIEDECCSGRQVIVHGTLLNNGTIKNTNGGVTIYARGNVVNNGTMKQSGLCFNGSGDQQISGTGVFGPGSLWKDPDGNIVATSNLTIDSLTTVNLHNDVLNMGTFKLTKLKSNNRAFESGTIYSNGDIDISGFGVMHSNLDGNFTLVGNNTMEFGSITVLNTFKVGPGKIIQDECCAGRSITVLGDVINEGTIRNGYGGLTIYARANVINKGVMIQSGLCFNATGDQQISGSKVFGPGSIWKDPDGQIVAASEIVIDSLTTVHLHNDVLNMGTFKLTKLKSNNRAFESGTIYSNGDIDISGFGVMHSNLDGNFTLVGNNIMEFGSITVFKTFKVAPGKIIQDECCAGRSITVVEDIINEGTIRNGYGGLTLYAQGNVINNGIMDQSGLCFNNSGVQHISGSKIFEPGTIWKSPDGSIIADSPIFIDSLTSVDLANDSLIMGSYKLTKLNNKNGSYPFTGGVIHSIGEVDLSGINVLRSTLAGAPLLTGIHPMECGSIEMFGDLRIASGKIIQDECCAGRSISIRGNLYNSGILRSAYGGLTVYHYGNAYNYSTMAVSTFVLRTEGQNRNIYGTFDGTLSLEKTGDPASGNVLIDGRLICNGYFYLYNGVELFIPEGSMLSVNNGIWNYGSITNKGIFKTSTGIHWSGQVYLDAGMGIDLKLYDYPNTDNVEVTSYNSVHPKMKSAIKRWWKVKPNGEIKSYKLVLKYDSNILNGQNEDNLKVFVSNDEGESWKLVSTPTNMVIDKVNKTISVGTDQDQIAGNVGDIIVSTGENIEIPSISLSISGRKQIRVGPPNRYSVTYWNNNNFPTDYAFIQLVTNQGVHIMSVESKSLETGEIVKLPLDSLTYDGVNTEAILVVKPLGPNEVRTFDVILGAVPGLNKTMDGGITLGAFALWTLGTLAEEYISNTVVEGCYEMWRPVRHDESLLDASKKVVGNSIKKGATVENGLVGIAKKGAEKLVESTGRFVAWPVFLAKDIFDCMGNTIKGMKDYLNGNFDKAEKDLQKVTSWDPNAKEGPGGYGENGYMAVSAPMDYTIFFENKKEAQAPAWKIVILDTLDENVYDISTVKAGNMSHNMGVFTQEGNVLKWEFVEIELPPNVTPPEGEGWVKFTVHPKAGLPTGTVISNKADITFDLNKPIATNLFINTLDYDPPATTPLTLTQIGNKLQVTWSADDAAGAGIKKSMVFVASGEGPFDMAGVSDTNNMLIDIRSNTAYKVYVLSEDNVGNMEKEPSKTLDIVTGIESYSPIVPTEYKLLQNYPNPFNPSTTIEYWLPFDGNVTLSLYNILGEKVITLVNDYQKAGTYRKVINMNGYSSGMYLYKLESGKFYQVRKLLLVK